MIILGLTGSIGMGKTVAANVFRSCSVPVHDADKVVHDLMSPGGQAFDEVAIRFRKAVENGKINRKRLGDIVFKDPDDLKRLESILHPLVRDHKRRFLGDAARRRQPLVVLDVPLLYETEGQRQCDGVVTVSAPWFVQRARVLSRPGMTPEKFAAILAKQMPDSEKRRRSDFVVQTGNGRLESLCAIRKIIQDVRTWRGNHWPLGPCLSGRAKG